MRLFFSNSKNSLYNSCRNYSSIKSFVLLNAIFFWEFFLWIHAKSFPVHLGILKKIPTKIYFSEISELLQDFYFVSAGFSSKLLQVVFWTFLCNNLFRNCTSFLFKEFFQGVSCCSSKDSLQGSVRNLLWDFFKVSTSTFVCNFCRQFLKDSYKSSATDFSRSSSNNVFYELLSGFPQNFLMIFSTN